MAPDSSRSGGKAPRPSQPPPGRRAPATRQERRDAERRSADPRLAAARTVPTSTPVWKSPMVLVTLGAVAVGLLVILFASGVLGGKATSASRLTVPIQADLTALADPTNPRALGRADAPVTVDVWSDFQCPACKYFVENSENAFIQNYVKTGKARFVYRDYAFIDRGASDGESQQSAAAARCAADQGRFWPFHDYLFTNQNAKGENLGTFTGPVLASIADAVGLDRGKYDACMSIGAADKVALVKAETATGGSLQVSQTPTLAVNGFLQVGTGQTRPGGAISADVLGAAVDAAIAASGSATPGASATP